MKKIIGFDLDDTLAITKSPISDRMAGILSQLLENYDVCVITGGTFQQIKKQVIDRLNVQPELLQRFHAMPTCGTRYYRFNAADNEWKIQYANDLSDEQKAIRTKELKDRFVELYNLTLAFKEKVDYVKKTSDNIQVITRVSKTLDKLSDMIAHYIHKTFNTKSYIENKSDFYYCLWVLDRINELMGTLTPKEPIKK